MKNSTLITLGGATLTVSVEVAEQDGSTSYRVSLCGGNYAAIEAAGLLGVVPCGDDQAWVRIGDAAAKRAASCAAAKAAALMVTPHGDPR